MNTVSATSVPLFASLAMRANVAVAADVDVAAAFAKAAHTLNIFNCCCCCCCDAALFKLDVDHSFACFALYFLTLALELYAHTSTHVGTCKRMCRCVHILTVAYVRLYSCK